MTYSNHWGQGSEVYEKWFKNPWIKNRKDQRADFAKQRSVVLPDQIEDEENTKNWAWDIKNEWSDTYVQKYRMFVADMNFAALGKWTCEDLALYLIINFSNTNKLPFKWETGSMSFNVAKSFDQFGYRSFMYEAMRRTGASDFDRADNTISVPESMLSPGDMILLDQGDHDGITDHVQVITKVVTQTVVNPATNTGYFKVTKIYGVQGENNRSIQTQEDRDKYDADPTSENYIGDSLEYFRWNLEDDTYLNITRNETLAQAKDTLRPKYVRFNYYSWGKNEEY